MKTLELTIQDLLAQLLTTDYGGVEQKRRYLMRLLKDPALIQAAVELLEHEGGVEKA